MNLLGARPVSFEEPTIMLACHARFLFSAAIALALSALDPSALIAAAANSATANAAPLPSATTNLTNEISLVSHRAVYELTLLKSVGSKSPTAAQGRIAFDFTGSACDGYVQNFRQLTELQPAEGPTRVSDMHSATVEDADGRGFEFKMQTSIDSGAAESVDGKAWKSATGHLSVTLNKPRHGKFELDSGVVFPTDHL